MAPKPEIGANMQKEVLSETAIVQQGRLLLKDLARIGMYSLVLDLVRFPTTTKCLHEINGADHLLAEQLRLEALTAQ